MFVKLFSFAVISWNFILIIRLTSTCLYVKQQALYIKDWAGRLAIFLFKAWMGSMRLKIKMIRSWRSASRRLLKGFFNQDQSTQLRKTLIILFEFINILSAYVTKMNILENIL